MICYGDSKQLTISGFNLPLKAKPGENNRWVILSKVVSWDESALYYKNFKSKRAAATERVRLVLRTIIIASWQIGAGKRL